MALKVLIFYSKILLCLALIFSVFLTLNSSFFNCLVIGMCLFSITFGLFHAIKNRDTLLIICGLYIFLISIYALISLYVINYCIPETIPALCVVSKAQANNYVCHLAYCYLLIPASIFIFVLIGTDACASVIYLVPLGLIPSAYVAIKQYSIGKYYATVHGFSLDASSLGFVIFMAIAISIIMAFRLKKIVPRILLFSIICVYIVALVKRQSITSWGAMFIFLISYVVFIWEEIFVFKMCKLFTKRNVTLILLLFVILCLIPVIIYHSFVAVALNRLIETGGKCLIAKTFEILKNDPYILHQRPYLTLMSIYASLKSLFMGLGPGGFYIELGNFTQALGLPFVSDNAANHYLQVLCELGLLGLLYNLFIHLFPLAMYIHLRKLFDKSMRIITDGCFCIIISMLAAYVTGPHTIAPDVAIIFGLIISYLYCACRQTQSISSSYYKQFPKIVIISSLIALPIFCGLFYYGTKNRYMVEFDKRMKASGDYNEYWNFYYEEATSQGKARWTKEKSKIITPAHGLLEVKFIAPHPDIDKGPLVITLSIDKNSFLRKYISSVGEYRQYLYIGEDNPKHELEIQCDRTWSPKKFKINDDKRNLGIMVSVPLKNVETKQKLGFHEEETWSDEIPSWPNEVVKRFRWTSGSATLDMTSMKERTSSVTVPIYLLCSNPDIRTNPVTVTVTNSIGDNTKILFNCEGWQKIDVNAKSEFLVINTDKTWCPSRAGKSSDKRELGVGVAIPSM